ncbi:hypothetical protein APA66_27680 [Pseudomonas aeruginosa]|uniref:hypothetical protein n=1 Tax=Pseudomonas aeruginosa TaxID=287 RepID=UPI00071B5315|nr:hypothetical protein [Pseudomonas aeruginosa]KSM44956.1 hypothetical protein APA66_27680 [Pseudomonas aeruginosa]HEI9901563.1 hypothetical protein [Pseudomonas aeruginosa]
MSIDWSKANGSAVAALIAKKNNIHYPGFEFVSGYHRTGCMIRATSADDGSPLSAPEDVWEIVERPVTWNGQGLPPVGTVCIVEPHNTMWGFSSTSGYERKILAYYGEYVWLGHAETPLETTRIDKVDFRPIRIPEQIAAEEREAAIVAMLDLDPPHENGLGLTSRRQFCETLYDAGYRRQEEGK